MAVGNVGSTVPGMVADADLSGDQHRFVSADATDFQVTRTGAAAKVLGVLQNKPDAAGKAASVWGVGSTSKMVAGAAVAAGAEVESDASGRAVTLAAGISAGVALSAAANANEIISVFLT